MKFIYLFIFCFLFSCQTGSKDELKEKTNFYIRLAQGYVAQCLYPQALFEVKRALDVEPDSYIVNDTVGVIYFLMKQYDKAQLYFKKSIQLQPKYTEAKVNIAQTLMAEGIKKNGKKALSYLRQAEKDLTYTNPSKVQARLGEIYFNQRKYKLALKHFETSLQINPKLCSNRLYLGRVHADQNRHSEAVRQFKQARKCQSKVKKKTRCDKITLTDHYYFQALSEMKIGQTKNAMNNLKLFIKKSDKSNPYLALAQNLLKNLGNK